MRFFFAGLHTRVVRAGGAVTGVVVVVTEDDKDEDIEKTRELRVVVRGTEQAEWQQLLSGKSLLSDEPFFEKRVVLEQTAVLWTRDDNDAPTDARRTTDEGKTLTQPGTHTFRFRFQLPTHLPGSFDEGDASSSSSSSSSPLSSSSSSSSTAAGAEWIVPSKSSWPLPVRVMPDCGVRYTVQAFLVTDRDPSVPLMRRTLPFVVRENFNDVKITKGPQTKSASKTFFLAGNQPLHLKATLLERVGFMDDELHFTVELRNFSSRTVDGLTVSLRQAITLVAGDKTLKRETTLESQRISSTAVPAGDSENFTFHVKFHEHHGVPSVMLGKLIAVKYMVEVEARVPRAINLAVTFPFQFVARTRDDETLAACSLPVSTTSDTADDPFDDPPSTEKPPKTPTSSSSNAQPSSSSSSSSTTHRPHRTAVSPQPRPAAASVVQRTVTDSSLHDLNEAPTTATAMATSLPSASGENEQILQLLAPSSPTPPASPSLSSTATATPASAGRSSLRHIVPIETDAVGGPFSLQSEEDEEEEGEEIVLEMSAV